MKKCAFCNYQDKEVIIYKDAVCYAVISHDPINKHHVLVIPKKHYMQFTDLPDAVVARLFVVAKKLSLAVRKACNPIAVEHISDDDLKKTGINLVEHYKLHIIPRFKNDKITHFWNRKGDKGIKVRASYAKDIKKCLKK
ncbi:HIT family protein [Candidatus Woesearchaeota archaeon]|nr:MAG: HIT family protein [Candidatus Woesearchaeota archaeon]